MQDIHQEKAAKKKVYVIHGEAGTGKSVILSSLFNTLQEEARQSHSVLAGTKNFLLVNHSEMLKTYQQISESLPYLKKKDFAKPTTFINNQKIEQADIVLIGVSRTSKTPLSQFLAHKRLKVANVPLVPEVEPPEELFLVPKEKCFGLVISPEKLNNIRKERLIALGLNDSASYAKVERIDEEINHFYRIVDRIDCQVIDVTNKAVEETANDILRRLKE